MLTSVRRDIQDHSISGDKIFGGTINWIAGLYTDSLNVPHTGSSGAGTINGDAFSIGMSKAIGGMYSTVTSAKTLLGLRNAADNDFIMYSERSGSGVRTRIRNSSGDTRIYFHTGTGINFFADKLMVGQKSALDTNSFFETPSGNIEVLKWATSYGDTSYLGQAYAKDSFDSNIALSDLIDWVYLLNSFFIDGTSIAEPWDTLKDLTASEAEQLLKIDSTVISGDNWGYVPSLDQNVGTNDTPTFEGINIGSIEVGETNAVNLLESYKEWIGESVNVQLGTSSPLITAAVKMDVVKCGKLVTIDIYIPSNQYIELKNDGATPLVGSIIIPISETIFSSILISSAAAAPGIIRSYYLLNDTDVIQCYISPPFVGVSRLWISDISGTQFTVAAGESLYLRSFSISYIVKNSDFDSMPDSGSVSASGSESGSSSKSESGSASGSESGSSSKSESASAS
jgi:hypothetical protein